MPTTDKARALSEVFSSFHGTLINLYKLTNTAFKIYKLKSDKPKIRAQ